jgi:hypothetical protein
MQFLVYMPERQLRLLENAVGLVLGSEAAHGGQGDSVVAAPWTCVFPRLLPVLLALLVFEFADGVEATAARVPMIRRAATAAGNASFPRIAGIGVLSTAAAATASPLTGSLATLPGFVRSVSPLVPLS